MSNDEIAVYLLASRLEFEGLCKCIVHDGRDPFWVAQGLKEKLSKAVQYYQDLWEVSHELAG